MNDASVKELLILEKIEHRNVIQIYGHSEYRGDHILVIESALGDLGTFIELKKVSNRVRKLWCRDVAAGLNYSFVLWSF